MEVKIIKNVIIEGKQVGPGTEKPMIIDVDEAMAANLKKIGCGVDPSTPDLEPPEDPAFILSEKDSYIARLEDRIDELIGISSEANDRLIEKTLAIGEKLDTIEVLKISVDNYEKTIADFNETLAEAGGAVDNYEKTIAEKDAMISKLLEKGKEQNGRISKLEATAKKLAAQLAKPGK
ncbi:hypothetical protein ES708_01520 [subsurface metagenome]